MYITNKRVYVKHAASRGFLATLVVNVSHIVSEMQSNTTFSFCRLRYHFSLSLSQVRIRHAVRFSRFLGVNWTWTR